MSRKTVSAIMMSLLVLGTLALAFYTQTVRASGTIYIRADGSIDPPTAPIQRNGNTYTLTGNITADSDGIVIERDNIVVDGAGYAVTGSGWKTPGSGNGTALTNRSNVTVRNLTIKNFLNAITLYSSSGNTLSSNNVANNGNGILLDSSSDNTLSGNNIANNYFGIGLWGSSYNALSGNNVTASNIQGIELSHSSDKNTLSGNNAANNGWAGIELVVSSGNTLSGNVMVGNGYNFEVIGLVLSDFLQSVDTSNAAEGKPVYYFVNQSDVVVNADAYPGVGYLGFVNCVNVTVQGFNLTKSGQGLLLAYTNDSKITGNNIANNYEGIELYSSYGNTLSRNNVTTSIYEAILLDSSSDNTLSGNNVVANNYDGIYLGHSYGNTLSGNNVTASMYDGIYLWGSSDNALSGNNVTASNVYGIYLNYYSDNNTLSGNDVTATNEVGIYLYLSSHNFIFHNSFVNNTNQVYTDGLANVWDDGYPAGGNYWSDYKGTDLNGDGIGDTPYVIDANNKDRYPLMHPVNQTKQTELLALFEVLSGSYFGNVRVGTTYSSPENSLTYPIISLPSNESVNVMCIGWLDDYKNEPLNGKEVKLVVDDTLISSCLTTDKPYNLNWTIALNLSAGLHSGELNFEGDGNYDTSTFEFTILAYKDSQFNITKDAFHFANWDFSFDEFGQLVTKLLQENVIDQTLEIPLLILYPKVSAGGHCFGMAAASSAYYLDPSLEPRPVETYALSDSDALWDINWYQLSQLWVGKETSIASSLSSIESLLDSGTPVVLGIKEAQHAITLIGYYQGSDETFLVAYDNTLPNSTAVYCVKDGKLMYDSTNVTSAVFVDPHTLPLPYHPTEFLKEIFTKYFGLQIHSPVDINITSISGKELLIENNTVVRNDFDNSYVYLGESKIILLPSSENCTMEATGTANGQVSLDCVFTSGDQIVIHQSQNVTISNGSRLYLPSLQSTALYVDSNGDGIIDQTITIPEFSSSIVLLLFLISIPLIIAVRKRHAPSKSRDDVS